MPTLIAVLAQHWIMKNLSGEEQVQMRVAANRIVGFIREVKKATDALAGAAVRAALQAEIDHERGALLDLYRKRNKWKKADLTRLNTYKLNKAARKRMVALAASRLLGPGSTVPYESLAKQLAKTSQYFVKLFDPATSANERMRLLKRHRTWWPQFIEMTYRGEYERLKKLGGAAPSEMAEQAVADAFCISCSSVRRECILARRALASHQAMSEPLTVADFEVWKRSGRLPD